MFYDDTIAAIATSSQNGSISVIRISGKQSLDYVSMIFYNRDGKKIDLNLCETHTIHYGFIRDDGGKWIDEVFVMIMRQPRSYTSENVVEIQCHGGYLICQLILELLVKKGVRLAEPGEFTKRAFLNGRLDLSQAESVMDVIQSKSELALNHSLMQLRGSIKEKIIELRNLLLEDIAFLEAALDDPEHLSLDGFSDQIKEHMVYLKKEVDHLLKNSQNGRIIREGIYTAIIGKPNVGKSSFLNCILREDRAIVTDIPGTTRDTLEEDVHIGSALLHLIDTAGIRNTEDKIESIGIEKAKRSIERADFVICIFDGEKPIEEEDRFILEQSREKKGVVLLNKSDKKVVLTPKMIASLTDKKCFYFSAKTGEGLRELEKYLNELFMSETVSYDDEVYITNLRQKEALIETKTSIEQLFQSIRDGMPEDLYTIDLTNAYESLGKIIGETVEEDIINKIFKDFCMGK